MMTFYNSTWYVVGLFASVAVGLAVLIRRRNNLAVILYFAVPAVFYLLLVDDPRTHVYTLFPAAAILAGLGVVITWQFLHNRKQSPAAYVHLALIIVWLIVVVAYPILVFLDTSVERQRTWAENRPSPTLYPTTWDEPPQFGLFGFPHQAGWRAAAQLRSDVPIPYGSNEEPEIADWYMAQTPRTYCRNANTFVLAANAQDEVPYEPGWLSEEMSPWAEVNVNGVPKMTVYARESQQQPVQMEATAYDLWLTPSDARRPRQTGSVQKEASFGNQIRLLGYDVDDRETFPGGQLTITLYWQALEPIERNFQVFVHLYDGKLWAQHDGAPSCDFWPTTRWEPGRIVADAHIIEIPSDVPTGSMPVLVGLYDLITEERLPVIESHDDAFRLTEVSIEPG
jgi:hypothetical protein